MPFDSLSMKLIQPNTKALDPVFLPIRSAVNDNDETRITELPEPSSTAATIVVINLLPPIILLYQKRKEQPSIRELPIK